MGAQNVGGSIFQIEDRLGFQQKVSDKWGDRATIAEQDLHWYATGAEINAQLATTPGPINELLIASNAADSGSELRMTQRPRIDGQGKQAGDTMVFIGAARVVVDLYDVALALEALAISDSDLQVPAAALAGAVMADLVALERSVLQFFNGSVLRFSLTGVSLDNVGASRALQALYSAIGDATIASPFGGGDVKAKDHHWQVLQPFEIGIDQMCQVQHWVPQRTYASLLRVDLQMRALVATVT